MKVRAVVVGGSTGGRACQERREPIHGGSARTSLFATVLTSPPPNQDSAFHTVCPFMNDAVALRSAQAAGHTIGAMKATAKPSRTVNGVPTRTKSAKRYPPGS